MHTIAKARRGSEIRVLSIYCNHVAAGAVEKCS
jgi:hypothetical protein